MGLQKYSCRHIRKIDSYLDHLSLHIWTYLMLKLKCSRSLFILTFSKSRRLLDIPEIDDTYHVIPLRDAIFCTWRDSWSAITYCVESQISSTVTSTHSNLCKSVSCKCNAISDEPSDKLSENGTIKAHSSDMRLSDCLKGMLDPVSHGRSDIISRF